MYFLGLRGLSCLYIIITILSKVVNKLQVNLRSTMKSQHTFPQCINEQYRSMFSAVKSKCLKSVAYFYAEWNPIQLQKQCILCGRQFSGCRRCLLLLFHKTRSSCVGQQRRRVGQRGQTNVWAVKQKKPKNIGEGAGGNRHKTVEICH